MRKEPEIITVTLKKQNGMGLSIVAAKVWKSVCVSVMENFFVRFICAFVGEEGGGADPPFVENVNGKTCFP